MAEKYVLRVTAGPSYDASTHVVIPTNTETATTITSEHCTARISVRIQNFRGLPRNLPSSSAYFSHGPHEADQYSIQFAFVPHASHSGSNLVFGNDFDRPVRDRLPPGFNTAFRIVKWMIDPGLEGDVYADQPYLYGPALSSLNIVRVGPLATKDDKGNWALPGASSADGRALEEGAADDEAHGLRTSIGCPDDAAARKKWALTLDHRAQWEWQAGRVYEADFFNPYLDFNTFSLKLPGFNLCVLPFLDGKENLRRLHDLRYVLKDKETGQVFFVVVFTLILKEDVENEEAVHAQPQAHKGAGDEQQATDKKAEETKSGQAQTNADDVD